MITILLSHERSGSHLVNEYAGSLGYRLADEVCNPNAVDPLTSRMSFLRFRANWTEANREIALKFNYADHMAFLKSYFEHIQRLDDRPILVDIKYGHLHNFERHWKPVFDRPVLFEAIEMLGLKLIHLHRRNVVETAVSSQIADQRQVWHSTDLTEATPADQTHVVDAAKVVAEARLLLLQTEWIGDNWVKGTNSFDLVYEDVVAALAYRSDVFARLAGFLEVPFSPGWTPNLQKLGRSLKSQLSNYPEVRAACQEAGLADYLPAE